MSDWNKPSTSSSYMNFITELNDRLVDLALAFDGRTVTNLPTGAIRFNSSSNLWQKWSGSAWTTIDLAYAKTSGATFTGGVTFQQAINVAPVSGDAILKVSASSGYAARITLIENNYPAVHLEHNSGLNAFVLRLFDSVGANAKDQIVVTYNGAVVLRYGSTTRLETTNSGVAITGALTVDGVDVKNAATAAKLATARTIGGVSFDGSANINLPGVNTAGNQNTSGNAATATKLATSRTISLTGAVTGSASFNGTADATISTTLAGGGSEKGTFTPTVVGATTTGTCSYSVQSGRYVKTGNVVHYWIDLVWSSHTGTGEMRIAGLPYTPTGLKSVAPIVTSELAYGYGTYGDGAVAYALPGQTYLKLSHSAHNYAPLAFQVDAAGGVSITGIYEVA